MPFAHEVLDGFLKKVGRKNVHGGANRYKMIHQIVWNHDVTQPQGRKKNFAEGSDVDYAGIMIKPLQGGNGRTLKAVLAVIVVLDDPGSRPLCPVQELHATRSAHRRAERVLMGRRNVGRPRFGTSLDSRRDHHAVLIDRNGNQTATCAHKDFSCQPDSPALQSKQRFPFRAGRARKSPAPAAIQKQPLPGSPHSGPHARFEGRRRWPGENFPYREGPRYGFRSGVGSGSAA